MEKNKAFLEKKKLKLENGNSGECDKKMNEMKK